MARVLNIVLLTILLSLSTAYVYKLRAQSTVLEQLHSFHFTKTPLENVIDTLRKKASCGFSYNPVFFPETYKITATFRDQKLRHILDSILTPAGLVYKLVDNNIVIRQANKEEKIQTFSVSIERNDTIRFFQLTGQIIDKKTKEPVEYASVYIKNNNTGTVSNEDGNFVLKLPPGTLDDSVYFSCIGYKTLPRKINDLNEYNSIALEPHFFQLKEVRIQPIDPEDILKKAKENIPNNYSSIPLMLSAFYRETIRQNNEYVALSEAILKIFKSPYDSPGNDQVVIYKGRKSRFPKQMDTVVFKFQGGIFTSLMLDIAKNPPNFLSDEYMKYYDFKLEEAVRIQDRYVYVISFDQRPEIDLVLHKGRLYIDMETYAIVRADFAISPRGLDMAAEMLIRKSSRKFKVKPSFSAYVANYTLQGNRWYLNYISEEVQFKVKKKLSLYNTTFHLRAQMVITETDSVNIQRFKPSQQVRMKDIFVESLKEYDPAFWGSYNVIKPDESLENAFHRIKAKP